MNALTHDTEPRGYRLVECHGCGRVYKCTPRDDAYVLGEPLPGFTGKPLYCEPCMLAAPRDTSVPAEALQ